MNETPEWTSPKALSELAAEELHKAMNQVGIMATAVFADSDGDIWIVFAQIQDAETLVSLALEQAGPGTVYDRATESCESMNAMGPDAPDEEVDRLRATGWRWHVHPHLQLRRTAWHARVYMPTADANHLTANLNALRLGGAL